MRRPPNHKGTADHRGPPRPLWQAQSFLGQMTSQATLTGWPQAGPGNWAHVSSGHCCSQAPTMAPMHSDRMIPAEAAGPQPGALPALSRQHLTAPSGEAPSSTHAPQPRPRPVLLFLNPSGPELLPALGRPAPRLCSTPPYQGVSEAPPRNSSPAHHSACLHLLLSVVLLRRHCPLGLGAHGHLHQDKTPAALPVIPTDLHPEQGLAGGVCAGRA